MTKRKGDRPDFASKMGLLLATAGSAVGLGNIWRFPVETGNNGGGAFILIYLVCIVLFGMPLMTAEFVIGRHAHTNTANAYGRITRHPFWAHLGKFGVFIAWFILCYYIVVSGWTLYYLGESAVGQFGRMAAESQGDPAAFTSNFTAFVANPWKPLLCMLLFVGCTQWVIVRGVQGGIERCSKVLMPLLFLIMCVLVACSLFAPGTKAGLHFLFRPDFSKVTFQTILAAMGQAFFSLSIAMGCLTTYASYFSREAHLVGTALKIGIIDTIVAVMAGVIIFPAVFSTGLEPDTGASLVFIALPNVFQQAFGACPWLSYAVSLLFYALLVLATLTSAISVHEVPTAFLAERFHLSRASAASIVTGVCVAVGTLCSISVGAVSSLSAGGRSLFDWFDFISGQIFLPLNGLLIAIFAGWVMSRRVISRELTNHGALPAHGTRQIIILLKYFAPVSILLIFLFGVGVLRA